jgi:type VI secretion system secreted protein VgrG
LNGDPDSPIIVGRVYNDFNDIPYQSPTQSGFKTRSTPKGAASDFNEIRFEDKKGSEELALHGQKNVSITAEANESVSVGANQAVNVGHNRTVGVGNNETYLVKVDQNNYVGGTQTSVTIGLQTNILKAGQFTKVTDGEQTIVADAGQSIKAKGQRTKVDGFRKLEVSKNDDIGITGYQTTKVGEDYAVVAKGNVKLKAGKKRVDVTTGDHWVLSSAAYKLSADAGIQFMTPANIDSTSMGSNTTIMGQNSSGYIGMDSSFTLALARNTFVGGVIDNTIAVSISNFGGASLENFLGAKVSSAVGVSVDLQSLKSYTSGVFIVGPGSGAAATTMGSAATQAWTAVAGLGALAGMVAGIVDKGAMDSQYEKARAQLKEAAKMARDEKLTKLANRLDALNDTGAFEHFFKDELPPDPLPIETVRPLPVGNVDSRLLGKTESEQATIRMSDAEENAKQATTKQAAETAEFETAKEAHDLNPSEESAQRLESAEQRLNSAKENVAEKSEVLKDAKQGLKEAAANEAGNAITKQAEKILPKSPPKPAP